LASTLAAGGVSLLIIVRRWGVIICNCWVRGRPTASCKATRSALAAEEGYEVQSGTISASNSPSALIVSSPTVTGSSNRRGPQEPGLK